MTQRDSANSDNSNDFSDDEIVDRIRRVPLVARTGDVTPPADVVWRGIEAKLSSRDATGRTVRTVSVDAVQASRSQKRGLRAPWKDGTVGSGGLGTQPLRWWIAVGAVVVLALAIELGRRDPAEVGTSRTFATNTTQGASLMLLDGTHVTLAPSTTLRLVHFGPHQRMVTVDGEAYFEVPKVAGAPFIVRSGAVATRVLGTSFLVRYRGDAGRVHIAVTDGKVTMAGLFAQRTLTAGDIGDATDSTVKVSTVKEMTPEVEWENGKIVFRDTPVPKVLAALTHWYGLQFKCADSAINKQSVTVLISPSSSSAALSKLEQVLDVSLTVVGDTVMLAPRAVPLRMRMPRMHSYDVWIPHSEVGR